MSNQSPLDLKKARGRAAASPRRMPSSPAAGKKSDGTRFGLAAASPRLRKAPPPFSASGITSSHPRHESFLTSPRKSPSPRRPNASRRQSPSPPRERPVTARYITPEMVQKVTKEENLALIVSLNLTFSPQDRMKIKYIENLEGMRSLRSLNLSGNAIEKIEKLQSLTSLVELRLASNCLTRIEGLDLLSNLALLDVTDNQIARLPTGDSLRKLVRLRDLRLAGNQLNTLRDVSRLKACTNLTKLTLARNPLTDVSHWWLFAVYHLRTLESLDDDAVTEEHQKQAKERFSVEEVSHLEEELAKQDEYIALLEEELTTATEQCKVQGVQLETEHNEKKRLKRTLSELEQDVKTKSEQLESKSAELARASRKHYELEQEMAFNKLDTKFDPHTWTQRLDGDSDDELEAPYMGRARFKPSSFAQELHSRSPSQKAVLHIVSPSPEPPVSPHRGQNGIDSDALRAALEQRNSEYQSAVSLAKRLGEELRETRGKLAGAEQELGHLRQQPDSNVLQEQLSVLQQQVNVWKESSRRADQELAASQRAVHNLDEELARARQREQELREQGALASGELSTELQRQIAALQEELYGERQRSRELQAALDSAAADAVAGRGDLEQRLADCEREAERLKQERDRALENARGGKDRADELAEQLRAQHEAEMAAAGQNDNRLRQLQQQSLAAAEEMRGLRAALERERQMREDAERQLEALRAEQRRQHDDAGREDDSKRHMLQAKDAEIAGLRRNLDQANQQLQALTGQQQGSIAQLQSDNFALRQALEESRTQQHQLQVEYEKQLRDLKSQLADKSGRLGNLEASFSSLHHPHALDGTLLARLSHLVGSLQQDSQVPGTPPVVEDVVGSPRARQVSSALAEFMESHTPRPRSAADTVDAGSMTRLTDEPTAELGRRLTKLMEALAEEAEVAQQRHAKAAKECKRLQRALDAAQQQLRNANSQEADRVASSDAEIEQVRQEVGELQELVDAERQRHAKQLAKLQADKKELEATLRAAQDQLHEAENALQDEVGAQDSHRDYSAELEAKMKDALRRLATLQQQLESECASRQVLQETLGQTERDRDALAAAVQRLQEEIQHLRSQLDDKECELQGAKAAHKVSPDVSRQDLSELTQAVADQQRLVGRLQQYLPQFRQSSRQASHASTGTGDVASPRDPRLDDVLKELARVHLALEKQQDTLESLQRSDEAPSSAESHIHIHTSPSSGAPQSYHTSIPHTAFTPGSQSVRYADAATDARPASPTAHSDTASPRLTRRGTSIAPKTGLTSRPTQTTASTSTGSSHTQSPSVPRHPRAPQTHRPSASSRHHVGSQTPQPYAHQSVSPIVAPTTVAENGFVPGTHVGIGSTAVHSQSQYPEQPSLPDHAAAPTTALDGSYIGSRAQSGPRPGSMAVTVDPYAASSSRLFDVSYRNTDGSSVMETPGRMSYADLAPNAPATHVHVHAPSYAQAPVIDGGYQQPPVHTMGRFCNIVEHGLLEDEVTQLRDSLAHSRSATRRAQELLHERAGVESLDDAARWKNLCRTRQQELSQLEEQLTCEYKKLHDTKKQSSVAKSQLQDTLASTGTAEKRLKDVQRVFADLSSRQRLAQEELQDVQSAINQAKQRQSHLAEQRGSLFQGVTTQEQELANLTSKLQEVQHRSSVAEAELSRSRHEHALAESRLSSTVAELRSGQEQLSSVKQAVADASADLSAIRANAQREQERLLETQGEVARCDREISDAQHQLTDLRSLLETTRADATRSEEAAQSSRLSDLLRETGKADQHLQSLRLHGQQLEAAARERQQQLKSEQQQLQASVSSLHAQHKEASEALAATRSKRLEEEGHLSSSRQQVREVEQEADVVRDRIDRMERDNSAAAAESTRQQQTLSGILAQVREAEGLLGQKRRDEEHLERQVANLKQQIIECQGALPSAIQEHAAVVQRTELAQSTLQSLLERCRITEEQLSAARQRLTEENRRLAQLKEQQLAAQHVQSELQVQCEKLQSMTQSLRGDQSRLESLASEHDSDVIRELKEQLRRVTALCEQREAEFSTLQLRYSSQREERKRMKETLRAERSKKREIERQFSSHQEFVGTGLQRMRNDIHGLHQEVVTGSQPGTAATSVGGSLRATPHGNVSKLSEHVLSSDSSSPDLLGSVSPILSGKTPVSLHDQVRQREQDLVQSKLDAQLARHEESIREGQIKAEGSLGVLNTQVSSLERNLLAQRSLSSTLAQSTPASTAASSLGSQLEPLSVAHLSNGSMPFLSSATDFSKMATLTPSRSARSAMVPRSAGVPSRHTGHTAVTGTTEPQASSTSTAAGRQLGSARGLGLQSSSGTASFNKPSAHAGLSAAAASAAVNPFGSTSSPYDFHQPGLSHTTSSAGSLDHSNVPL